MNENNNENNGNNVNREKANNKCVEETTLTNVTNLLSDALRQPSTAIAYEASRALALVALRGSRALIEADSCPFGLAAYARAGLCTLTPHSAASHGNGVHNQIASGWEGPNKPLTHAAENAWFRVSWNHQEREHELEVVLLSWPEGFGAKARCFVLAESQAVAQQFYAAVCAWSAEIRGEVLVFDSGDWHKSEELFQAIKSATFDNLVLAGDLKDRIARDLGDFFASRALYEQYGVPWKRGVLFLGPPGNGKTHTLKALLNASPGVPCLYVKSFKANYRETDQDNIRKVFRRARACAPCLLVLEDLDSLIDDENRSFFLNELDGFADNAGIVTLATTNHSDKLDPAISERPSRFDRKYHFGLPGEGERLAYVHLWNDRLQPELRLSEAGARSVVAGTEGFSFAYLKELFLSATMRWMADRTERDEAAAGPGGMDAAILAQAEALRQQMRSGGVASNEAAPDFALDDGDPVAAAMRAAMKGFARPRR